MNSTLYKITEDEWYHNPKIEGTHEQRKIAADILFDNNSINTYKHIRKMKQLESWIISAMIEYGDKINEN